MNLLRHLPDFKGKYRLSSLVNNFLLNAGMPAYQIAEMKNGTRFLVNLKSNTEKYSYYSGAYEPRFADVLANLIASGESFLDIGSNIGFFSVQVAHRLRMLGHNKPVIHSFEPVPANCIRQRANYQINDLQGSCCLHEYGLSDTNETLKISLREDFVAGSSTGNAAILTSDAIDRGFQTIDIEVKTLDSVWDSMPQLGPIGAVKIDVEGHEDFVLRGGRKTIDYFRPLIFMEVNKAFYRSREVNDIGLLFGNCMPSQYAVVKSPRKGKTSNLTNLNECSELDNVFLCPEEKLDRLVRVCSMC
jgi:FkbM family methyltransferase